MKLLAIPFVVALIASFDAAHAEPPRARDVTLLAGTLQPAVLSGWNVELDFRYDRFVFGYSHGWSLEIPSSGAVKDQQLVNHTSYSTGFGVGYEFISGLSLRFEPKLHRFEFDYEDASLRMSEPVADYRTITLGLGAYYIWRPFGARANWLRGLTAAFSVRYWHNTWTDLEGGELSYENRGTGAQEIHETSKIGIANTPWVGNLAVGYTIPF